VTGQWKHDRLLRSSSVTEFCPGSAIWRALASGRACCYIHARAYTVAERSLLERLIIMTTPSADQTAPPREGMFRELLYIHSLLRRDLRTVRRLADDARQGLSPESILTEINNLETTSPLWKLKFGCMYYCRFVHGHHTLEDAALFPMVRRQDPSLNSMVNRLEEDHLTVHHITERIAAVAGRIVTDETGASRIELVEALTDLEEHLLAHLALEEEALGPLLSSWDHWPVEQV
jgi:hypothetical protein